MTAAILDFTKENAIEIGTTFSATIQISDAPDLTGYAGVCHIRIDENSTDIVVSPTIAVISHDTFSLTIPHTSWLSTIVPSNYKYDVLFSKGTDRFYAVRGTSTLIKGVTKIA